MAEAAIRSLKLKKKLDQLIAATIEKKSDLTPVVATGPAVTTSNQKNQSTDKK